MSDLIQEVADDIRTEKFFDIVRKFTKVFITVAAVILLITAGVVYYNYKHEQKQLAFGVDYYQFQHSNNDAKALKQLTSANSEAFGAMANLSYAKSLLAARKYKEGFAVLTALINDNANDIAFRNLAKLIIMSTALAQELPDFKPERIYGESDSKQPFYNMIKLSYAQLLLQDKQTAEAKQVLEKLVADNDAFDNISFLANVLINNS